MTGATLAANGQVFVFMVAILMGRQSAQRILSQHRGVWGATQTRLAMNTLLTVLLTTFFPIHGLAQSSGKAAQWKGLGVSEGARLPSADQFKPRSHGDNAANA
jgi:hypothetical protein